jgi:hypothetical protein
MQHGSMGVIYFESTKKLIIQQWAGESFDRWLFLFLEGIFTAGRARLYANTAVDRRNKPVTVQGAYFTFFDAYFA